jgi:hypothetical protein
MPAKRVPRSMRCSVTLLWLFRSRCSTACQPSRWRSLWRVLEQLVGPATVTASPIGAVLDLLAEVSCERLVALDLACVQTVDSRYLLLRTNMFDVLQPMLHNIVSIAQQMDARDVSWVCADEHRRTEGGF